MAVVIINDSYGIANENSGIFISEISNYVDTYFKIVCSLHNNSPLEVIVRNPTIFKWLSKMKNQYGDTDIIILENNPREVLKRQWNLESLPSDVSDRQIIELNLLELKKTHKKGETFENIILENFYSDVLLYNEFPIYKIINLLEDLIINKKWETHKNRPIILSQYKKRLEEWIRSSKKEEYKILIETLKDNPISLYRQLMNFKLLKNYPSIIGERILGNNFYIYQRMNLNLSGLEIDLKKVEEAVNEIEIFLKNDVNISKLDDIEKVLPILSGKLVVEFDFLKEKVGKFKNIVTKELIDELKNKFSVISDFEQIQIKFKELDLLIPPEVPSEPIDGWSAIEWIKWAIDEYLPYQFWLEEINEFDDRIAQYSERFGDWFYNNFIKLKTDFPAILHKIIPNISYGIKNNKEICLLLVIDNFNYKYFSELCTFFNKKDFFCKETKAYFSMIPTETSVCKKSLFSGEPEINTLRNKSYEQIIQDAWSGYMGSKKFKFLSNIGALNNIRSIEHEVYILNYCNIDQLFHKDEGEIGLPHRVEIRHHLQNLVSLIVNFAKRLKIEHRFSIYVCSDHGSTKIMSDVFNIIDRKYYKTKSEDEHHRFVTITDEQMKNLPSHVEKNAYVVNKKEYGLIENLLIARGYGRFKKISGNYYVHGGLSPEEVIVPFALFNKVSVKPKEVIIHLIKDTFRYTVKSNIELEIVNTNDYEIADVSIDVLNSNVKSQPQQIEKIYGKSKVLIEIPSIFKKTPDKKESTTLLVNIRFKLFGENNSQKKEIPIIIKSMIEQKLDLKDLF